MKKTIILAAAFLILSAGYAGTLYARPAATSSNITSTAAVTNNQSLSRGGIPIQSQSTTSKDADSSESSTKITAPKYGNLLEWTQANPLIARGADIQVTDLYTGKSFNIKRTYGTNHIDGEALTETDTSIIKSIWGGFSWERRPVIVSINGQYIAASMSAMPHAGVDSAPAEATVDNRSEGYGTGVNLDAVKNNGMDGVIDIHFLNSTRHMDNQKDPQHQAAILKAAGK